MAEAKIAKFRFKGYTIEDARIRIVDPDISSNIEFDFSPSGILNKKEKKFTLFLGINMNDEKKCFNAFVNVAGNFVYDDDVENKLQPFLLNNAPALVFPYIRAYIAALTALSGIPCITLPTLNMQRISRTLEENIKEE